MRRFDTLFSRLLLAQAITAVALVMLFGVLFYVERNVTVARLVAQRWAPALRAAAGGASTPAASAQATLVVRRETELPWLSVHGRSLAPRIEALRESLRAGGVPVRDIAFSRADGNPLIWVAVPAPDGRQMWLGFEDELVEPRLPQRLLLAVLLGVLVVAVASWAVARWLAGPLARLRKRIEAHEPGDPRAPGAPDTRPGPGATVEVAAIDAAWSAMRERLARHERERRLLLAGVSHDLRSPLARIRMAAELLPEADGVAVRREAIVRNVDVTDRLVQSFLDHVRAHEVPLDESVDLSALARGVVAGLARPTVELQLDAPAALWLGQANHLLLERALLNLLDNAFRHGRPPVRLHLQTDGRRIHIDVEDAGAGIAPQLQASMLQAFARGDSSRGTPGTGLGLAVVALVAARLGGEVSFEAAVGLSRVRLTLPCRG